MLKHNSTHESKPQTSEEQAYFKVRKFILERELPEDEFLSQRDLAKKADVAVVTLRGALRRLEADQLIESVPRWGVRVPKETPERIQDRYFLRETFEVAAVRRIQELADPGNREQLIQRGEAVDRVALDAPDDYRLFAEEHHQFHCAIAEMSGSVLLCEHIERLNLRLLMQGNAMRGWNRGHARTQHRDYALALTADDLASAEEAARAHVKYGLQLELDALTKKG